MSVPNVHLSESEPESVSFSEAMSSQHRHVWANAMKDESKGLQMARTVYEDAIPPRRRPVGGKSLDGLSGIEISLVMSLKLGRDL